MAIRSFRTIENITLRYFSIPTPDQETSEYYFLWGCRLLVKRMPREFPRVFAGVRTDFSRVAKGRDDVPYLGPPGGMRVWHTI